MPRKTASSASPVPPKEEVMRTYKVGLRVPESLLTEQNKLVIELEVLNHVRKGLKGKISKLMSGKVAHGSAEVVRCYKAAEKKYAHMQSVRQVNQEIFHIRAGIKQLHWNNPVLNSISFKRNQVPSFHQLDAPSIQEISLTDYRNLASKSLKLLCKYLNDQVLTQLRNVPTLKQDFIELAFQSSKKAGKNYTRSQITNRFEVALANITGIHSNLGRTAFYQLGMAMKAYFDARDKVEFVQKRLDPSVPSKVDFSGEIPVLLAFYSLPNNLRKYIARAWNVDSEWVRNTLVGWRRKIDRLLPVKFQIEPLSGLFTSLAESFKSIARNEDDVKVISRLQGKHVLHLLPQEEVDLTPLLPKELHVSYRYLHRQVNQRITLLASHIHSFSHEEFVEAAQELIGKVQTTQAQFPPMSQPFTNCQTFVNKVTYLMHEANSQEVQEILRNYVIGNRFTRNVALLLAKGSKYSRLYTALRGIIALTLAKKHASAIGQFLSVFNPDNCLTFPFTSKNRVKSHLPVNLLFNKYIVERKAHPTSRSFLINESNATKPNVTDRFRNGEPIWLGLPIYAPSQEQEFQDLISGLRNKVVRKAVFWFRLLPGKKITECVQKGANVVDIRLNVPRGPTNKIVADIVLSSQESSVFHHRGRFLTAWDAEFTTLHLPHHDILGSDFNRIGKYMVATANPDEEHELDAIMELYEKTHTKLEKYRKWELPHLQKQLSSGKNKDGNPLSAKKRGRLETQVTLLHRKKQRLQKEMKRQALQLYLFIAWKTESKYLAWDALGGISTRGQSGALAQAITYLPKRKALFDEFRQWAQDLSDQGLLPHYIDTFPVSPFNSQVCAHCFQRTGQQRKTKAKSIPYDEFQCTICGRSTHHDSKIHRHSNSARVTALLLQKQVASLGASSP